MKIQEREGGERGVKPETCNVQPGDGMDISVQGGDPMEGTTPSTCPS
jgi:hypothetical protein